MPNPSAESIQSTRLQRPSFIRSSPQRNAQPRLSLVSAKVAMAITGASLLAFVAIHMLGNLQIYLGQEPLNAYAKFLKSMPLLLWTARIGLLIIFGLHLGMAVHLKRQNLRTRPQRYVVEDSVNATLASRTMLTSGLVILAFVVYHLLHFTLGITDPTSHVMVDAAGRHDVYSMVVRSFSNVYVSVAYIVAMLFLCLHLSHACSSILQTLGIARAGSRRILHNVGLALTAFVVIGNISIPISVLFGLIALPQGATP